MKIFLAGGDGAGKSTTAKALKTLIEQRNRVEVPVLAFGNLVRCHVNNTLPYKIHELREKPTPSDIRASLRRCGEMLRKQNPYHWVGQFEFLYEGLKFYILDDLRFEAEARFAVATGGYLVYLECPEMQEDSTFKELDTVKSLAHLVVKNPFSYTPNELARYLYSTLGLYNITTLLSNSPSSF